MEPTNKNYPPTVFISIFPTKEKKNANSPDFNVTAKIGEDFKTAGAAWKKQAVSGSYLSVSLDLEVIKKLIIEKQNTLQSNGKPMPFTDEPTDPFAGL